MTEIQTALLKCRHHWDDNVKSYPDEGSAAEKKKWFNTNAQDDKCALCEIMPGCGDCVLYDRVAICSKEWNDFRVAIINGTSHLRYVEAMRDRLKAECEKEGL